MSGYNRGGGGWGPVVAILAALTIILASVSSVFGGGCENLINAAFDGFQALLELLLPVGVLLLAVVVIWYLIRGKDTGTGTVSHYTFGIGAVLLFVGLMFSDVDLSSIGTEQCINGVGFIK